MIGVMCQELEWSLSHVIVLIAELYPCANVCQQAERRAGLSRVVRRAPLVGFGLWHYQPGLFQRLPIPSTALRLAASLGTTPAWQRERVLPGYVWLSDQCSGLVIPCDTVLVLHATGPPGIRSRLGADTSASMGVVPHATANLAPPLASPSLEAAQRATISTVRPFLRLEGVVR